MAVAISAAGSVADSAADLVGLVAADLVDLGPAVAAVDHHREVIAMVELTGATI